MKVAAGIFGFIVFVMFGSNAIAAPTGDSTPTKGVIRAAVTTLLSSSAREGHLIQYANMKLSLGSDYWLRAPAATSFQADGGPTFIDANSAVISSRTANQQPLYLTGAHLTFVPDGAAEITADRIYINGPFRPIKTATAMPEGAFPPDGPITCTADHSVAGAGIDRHAASICVGTIQVTCGGKNEPAIVAGSAACS